MRWCQFFLSWLLMAVLYVGVSWAGCVCICSCDVFLLSLSLIIMVVFVSHNSLYFKVCFVWYECCYSSFLLISICMKYFFPSLTFRLYMSLDLKCVFCRQYMYKFWFFIYSSSLCLLVEAFNPFTFKVVISIYVTIAILLTVLDLFL